MLGLARISHSVNGEGLPLGAMRSGGGLIGKGAFGENAGARAAPLRIGGAAWRYENYALSGSSARRGGEPGVGDPVFALVGEG